MNSNELQSLEGLPGDPDRSLPGFRRRFEIKVRRSLAKVSG